MENRELIEELETRLIEANLDLIAARASSQNTEELQRQLEQARTREQVATQQAQEATREAATLRHEKTTSSRKTKN